MKGKIEDKTWYLAIMRTFNNYSIFVGACGEQYRNFKNFAIKSRSGVQIVAEQFDISDEEINILDGFTKEGKSSEKNYLNELKQKMDSRMIQDHQRALEDLVNFVKSKKS